MNYHATLALKIEAYKREDLATVKQLAVPVDIPNDVYQEKRNCNDS